MASWQPDEFVSRSFHAIQRSQETLSDTDRLMDRLIEVRALLSIMALSAQKRWREENGQNGENGRQGISRNSG